MATKKHKRRLRRLILLSIVLGFIFIPERTVDEITEAPEELTEEVLQNLPISSEIVTEYNKAKKEQDVLAGTAIPVSTEQNAVTTTQASATSTDSSSSTRQKAQKSSSSPSQQYVDSSGQDTSSHTTTESSKPYYTIDRNGLYDLTGPVIDVANLLSPAQYVQLDSFLRNLNETTGVQIAVLTVPSLGGVAIEEFSIRHAEKWQLGQKGVDNGALLVASMEEHALRIETGYGTEAALTDAKCSQIIRNVLVPKFRDGKYGESIIEAVNNMAGIITEDESLVSKSVLSESSSSSDDDSEILYIILGAIILFIIFAAIVGNIGGGSSYSGGSYHSSGHSYSGGGHSFSGGGGHFGGGGASGHW